MKKAGAIICLLFSVYAFAQQDKAANNFAATITAKELKKKLTIVAGAAMEGRETATAGQRKAAAYIENYFKQIGLQPGVDTGYQMVYPVYRDSVISKSLSVNGTALKADKDYTINTSSITKGDWKIDTLIFASFGILDSVANFFNGLDIKNKWVMVIEGTPADMNKTAKPGDYANSRLSKTKITDLQKKDIKGLIIVSKDFPKSKPASMLGSMYIDSTKKRAPTIYVSLDVASKILGSALHDFTDMKKMVSGVYSTNMQLQADVITQHIESSNVVGVLPGTDKKDEYVFVTGHYDHLGKKDGQIYYGADDDGSGTVSVMQIATAFAKAKAAGKGPKRTMVFMTVSGEEEGLFGSEYYSNHPLFPLDKTSVDLNIDMVGRIDPDYKGDSMNYVYVIGEDKLSSDLPVITDSINNTYTKLQLDRKFNDPKDPNRIYYRSDHYNFANKGVPILFYFNGTHKDYHKPTDTVDKINFSLMEKRDKLVFYTAWDMANRNNMLTRDKPLPKL